ncbi:MAG: hypothetical protein IT373_05570 [Polyangiaceae bacterium]|nr:hypothetical protein [Polyangiaceae bacterium]
MRSLFLVTPAPSSSSLPRRLPGLRAFGALVGCVLLAGVALGTTGCEKKGTPEPKVGSSVQEANYAQDYPGELDAAASGMSERQKALGEATAKFDTYPDQVKEPTNYKRVAEVAEAADNAGKSEKYVERRRQIECGQKFLGEGDDAIAKKVASGVGYTAQQKGCSASDVQSATMYGFKKAIEEESKDRMRKANSAHLLIDRYKEEIGKDNVPKVEDQADEIADASYTANIELPERKNRLNKMIGESDGIKKTMDRYIDEEKAFQKEEGRTEAEKKASDERIAKMEDAKKNLDDTVKRAKEQVKEIDKQVADAQKQYTDQLGKLKSELKKRGSEQKSDKK